MTGHKNWTPAEEKFFNELREQLGANHHEISGLQSKGLMAIEKKFDKPGTQNLGDVEDALDSVFKPFRDAVAKAQAIGGKALMKAELENTVAYDQLKSSALNLDEIAHKTGLPTNQPTTRGGQGHGGR